VPFGKIAVHDKVHNAGGHSLHNYFILKSLALTRPGGVVCVLTSHYTMDAANPAARREIAALADLVAAVRLPMSAHQRAAGTQVITDVLILRRRDPAADSGTGIGWSPPRASAGTSLGRSMSTSTSPSIPNASSAPPAPAADLSAPNSTSPRSPPQTSPLSCARALTMPCG